MGNPEITPRRIVAFVRLRILYLMIPPIATTALSAVGAYFLPRQYESSIRILVQSQEVTNPLTTLANAMGQWDDSQLHLLDEIIFSERTYRQMIDSLGYFPRPQSDLERAVRYGQIKAGILTKMSGRSFTISFQDGDPNRAQKGASALANIFIGTVTDTKNQKSQMTVDFYEKKLEEFRLRMDESQNQIMAKMRNQTGGGVGTSASLYLRLDQIGQKTKDAEDQVKELQRILKLLGSLPEELSSKQARGILFEVQRSNVPYAADLGRSLNVYEDVLARYTTQHPEAVTAENRIREAIERISAGIISERARKISEMDDLQRGKAALMAEVFRSSGQKSDDGLESTYQLYQRLYTEMRLKLEEAQITKTLGSSLQNQYVVMDPAYLPLFPAKPSRSRIVMGGFGLGVFLGIMSAVIAEALDSTIRSVRSLEVYGKPVIAFFPERKELKK